jgi:hypothetical protein
MIFWPHYHRNVSDPRDAARCRLRAVDEFAV